ncbi:hypothetical protein AB0C76_20125 [Kitasatospora sp. NPDC048722]|uniref:hypothetical protein n=1 Tax=Kitasatospora sp. NPDC048722 TaxID=3155639 RepID=UPI0033C6D7A3
MKSVVSERYVSKVGLAVGAALVLATCAAGGDAVAATSPLGHGPVAGAPGIVQRTAAGVSITEGEVAEVGPEGAIRYPSVTSCLVVTVYLRDGGKVGGHASLFQVPGKYRSDEVLPAIRRAVGGRQVRAVDVSGAVGAWNPSYFEKAVEQYTDGSAPEPTGGARGIGDVVAKLLGQPRKAVTVQDVPDGDITR